MGFLDRLRSREPTPDEILEGELLVATPYLDREPGVVEFAGEDRQISVVTVVDEAGLQVLPAFTSEEALARWKPEGSPYVALPAEVLIEILAGSEWDRMVVDGQDEHGFVVTRSAARQLVGVTARFVPEGSSFRIGLPAEPPPEGLVEALRTACEREPALAEAYLYQFQIVEEDESPYLAIGLRLEPAADPSEAARVARSITREVNPPAWGYEFLEIHPLDDELLEAARSNGIPILHRRQ
jgi:hypothetical protein